MNPSRPRPERAPFRRRRSIRRTSRRRSGRRSGRRIRSTVSAAARRRVETATPGSTIHRRTPSPATRRRQLKPRSRTRGRQRAAAAAGARRGETPPSSRRPRRLSRGSIASNDRTSGFAPRANRASAPRSSDTRSFTRISRGFWCWRVVGITASVTTWSGGARSSRSASPPGGRCTLTRGDAAPGRGDRTAARTATSTPGTTSPATGSTGGGTRRGKRSSTSYSDARRPCERSITCVAKITRTPTAGRAS
mmetsp:Transcript_14927/g.64602  ORF Transcript_14927/g.64602 Transcript_14927/m.64602 type:complete len:250 (-) Transcript_14927:1328-2077(-)